MNDMKKPSKYMQVRLLSVDENLEPIDDEMALVLLEYHDVPDVTYESFMFDVTGAAANLAEYWWHGHNDVSPLEANG